MLLVILVLAFGPARITDIGKSMGEALAGFREASKEVEEPASSEPEANPATSTEPDDDVSPRAKTPSLASTTPKHSEDLSENTPSSCQPTVDIEPPVGDIQISSPS